MNLQQVGWAICVPLVAFINLVDLSFSAFAQSPAVSSENVSTTFFCKFVNGIPNTVARVTPRNVSSSAMSTGSRAGKMPVVEEAITVFRWERKDYPESKESPMERCTRVSTLLQTYKREGKLNYISSGVMDGRKVICTTSGSSGPCSRLIFLLEPEEESEEETQRLLADLRKIIDDPTLVSSKQAGTGSGGGGSWIGRLHNRWLRNVIPFPGSSRGGGASR
jgi:hypothetical protein